MIPHPFRRSVVASAAQRDTPFISETVDRIVGPGFVSSARGLPPVSLYTFGPITQLSIGKRLEPSRPLSASPTFESIYGWTVPEYERIWRLVPDDPGSVRSASASNRWLCGSAIVVEEISPTALMPGWDHLVILCRRLADLTDGDVRRIAMDLATAYPSPQAHPKIAEPVACHWAARSVRNAAQIADSPDCPIMFRGRAGGGWYEEITDAAWLRVEDAADSLADGLELGTATLEREGAPFGPWDPRGLDTRHSTPDPVSTDGSATRDGLN